MRKRHSRRQTIQKSPTSVTERDRRAAKKAGLRYVTDDRPGIRRRKTGARLQYIDTRGNLVRNPRTLSRITALVIPPAWKDVWISPAANGHIQATGKDARGRKQYRYHDRWRRIRDDDKYRKLIRFAKTLPKIRRRVAAHLRLPGLSRRKVLAGAVKLLETTLIRVGNEEYAKTNDSFGLTTLRDRHAAVRGSRIRFTFQGKSGVTHEIQTSHHSLAKLVGKCQKLPGRELFQYVGEDHAVHDITAADVNDYLREISGEDFTAKDFRTWAGTVLAARALKEFKDVDSQAAAKRNVRQAVEQIAERLGNTVAVCRKCYIHPAVINGYLNQGLIRALKQRAEKELRGPLRRLPADEAAVLVLLQRHLKRHTT